MRGRSALLPLTAVLVLVGSDRAAVADDEGAKPISRTGTEIMGTAAATPRPTPARNRGTGHRRGAGRSSRVPNPALLTLARGTPAPLFGALAAQSVTTNFTSVTLAEAQVQPPDTMGAVGPTQFLTHVNGRVRVHDKATGAIGALDVDDLVFWASVATPGAGTLVSSPHVRYDRLTDRWFLMVVDEPQSVGTTPGVSNRVLIAVSDGATITAGTVWRYYYFNIDTAPPVGDPSCVADFPSLGLDNNALYIGANIFCGPGPDSLDLDRSNATAWVVRKSALLNAATPANLVATAGAVTAFRDLQLLQGLDTVGLYSPQGVDNVSPTASVGYFVGVDNAFLGRLVLRAVNNPGSGSPTLGPNVLIDVADTEVPIPVPIPGPSGLDLEANDDSLLNAVLRDGKIWTSQQIQVDATGIASAIGGRNGTRWYAIDAAAGSVAQTGTIFDSAASNPTSYWMSSVGVSGQGHVAFGFTAAGATTSPGAATVGRLAGDPPGTTQGTPLVYKAAEAIYDPPSGIGRWGDYSMTSLDPCDDMTLWTIQEFAAAGNNWGTQVARLLAPPPLAPSTASSVVPQGQPSFKVTLTGDDWYDPPATGMSACRTPLSVAVSGGVTVNSVTFVSPTQITVDLNTVGTPVGPKTVTVTNPDGQGAAAAILNVFSIPVIAATKTVATNPGGPFVAGANITYTVTLTNTGTFTQGDNPGSELTDVLPSAVTLISASASSGTAVATVATNTVTWNGPIAANGGSVTITIEASILAGTPGSTAVSNQGTVIYDANANGSNETVLLTDDPSQPGASDPTVFHVPASFYTLEPCRVVDTRGATGPRGAPALTPGSRSFTLTGVCGLPADAKVVSLNVTVTAPTQPGDLRLYPAGTPLPLVSTVNYAPGQTRANNAVALLSSTGALAVQCDQAGGTVDLIIDVNGYFK
jgi:uncharacterized repeat protein (TIGR01451 family)